MSILTVILTELRDARATGYKRVVYMRITTDALRGSVTSTPVTPERARVLGRLIALRDENSEYTVAADPSDYEAMLEILIHPEDWRDLLKDMDAADAVLLGTPDRVWGIPVTNT